MKIAATPSVQSTFTRGKASHDTTSTFNNPKNMLKNLEEKPNFDQNKLSKKLTEKSSSPHNVRYKVKMEDVQLTPKESGSTGGSHLRDRLNMKGKSSPNIVSMGYGAMPELYT